MFRQSLAPVKHCAKKPLDTAGEWCAQRHWHLEFGGDGTGSKLKASNFDEVWVISIFVNLKMTVDRWVKHIEHQEIPKWNRHHIKSQQTSKHLQTNMSMDLQSHQKKGGLNTWEFSEKNQSKSYCKEVDNSVFPVYIYIYLHYCWFSPGPNHPHGEAYEKQGPQVYTQRMEERCLNWNKLVTSWACLPCLWMWLCLEIGGPIMVIS